MICAPCRDDEHEQCDVFYRVDGSARDEVASTWCDCQHGERCPGAGVPVEPTRQEVR